MATIAYFTARKFQEADINDHKNAGGEMFTGWRAFWVSLLAILVTFAFGFIILLFFGDYIDV